MTTAQTQPTPAQSPDAQPVQAAQHTPGPWATDCDVETYDGADLPYVVYINSGSEKGGEICTMLHEPNEGRGRDWEEGKANARLIASAPALLAERDGYRQALETEKMLRASDVRELRAALETILEGAAPQGRETWTLADVIQEHYRIARAALEGGAK